MKKVVRSICYFAKEFDQHAVDRLFELEKMLVAKGFVIQTKRMCCPGIEIEDFDEIVKDKDILLSVGEVNVLEFDQKFEDFIVADRVSLNLNLTDIEIEEKHVSYLFDIIKRKPGKTFNFAYTFNNAFSSPYFPSATYEKDGFAIGLQSTDLANDCESLEAWFLKMKVVWQEIDGTFAEEKDYIGIDSSIAPLFEGDSSLIEFVRRLHDSFSASVLIDTYLKITKFIKEQNPKPIGLCGLMLPCLEDFELAKEYEDGNFSIERNLFLSSHSGLGIDTYPVGVDESPERVIDILKTVQGLANKYKKPLSARFVSDGKARIGDKTDFQNQYLKDVVIRAL